MEMRFYNKKILEKRCEAIMDAKELTIDQQQITVEIARELLDHIDQLESALNDLALAVGKAEYNSRDVELTNEAIRAWEILSLGVD